MRINPLKLLALVIFLGGCATNPYADFYSANSRMVTRSADSGSSPPLIVPFSGQENLSEIGKMYLRKGYTPIGHSAFEAAEISETDLLEQATKVGADVVLTDTTYLRTNSGTIPLTLPTTQTTYHSGSLYGGLSGSYSGTSTSYGSQTTYIPYQNNRYSYYAEYWAKAAPPKFGIRYAPVSPEARLMIGSNKGVTVTIVVENSPAFLSDVLEGDVILALDKNVVRTPEDLKEIFATVAAGQVIDVELFRNGVYISKTITLR